MASPYLGELPNAQSTPEHPHSASKRVKMAHLDVARRVIRSIGTGNLVFMQGSFWRWGTGVWERINEREIRVEIHQKADDGFTKGTVDSVLDILKTEVFRDIEPAIPTSAFINCINGELHFKNGAWQLGAHNRESFQISQIPVRFNARSTAPRFQQFLHEIFENDVDASQKREIVLEMIGYTLLQTCNYERFIILIGNGANGKSVLLGVVGALTGLKNVSAVKPSDFANRFQRAHLHGKLANIVTEIAEGSEIADAELKAIVSGEILTAERKRRDPFDFRPYCTCWFGTNHMPHTRDFSTALLRRAKIIPFNNQFTGERCDIQLKDTLSSELEGILNLSLNAVGRVLQFGSFTSCESEERAKQEWRIETDQAAQFVEEKCELDSSFTTASKTLFDTYRSWADDEGIKRPLNHKNFTQRLQRLGVVPSRGVGGVRLLAGIRCKDWF
jgi:putative DNA primase/helicase